MCDSVWSRALPRLARVLRSAGISRVAALLLVAGASAVAGCNLTPTYKRPAAPVSPSWPTSSNQAAANARSAPHGSVLGWREVFTDARLDRLIDLALQNNRDLRVAVLNVELARAAYQIQGAALYPQVGASGSVTRARVPADQSVTGKAATGTMWTGSVGVTAYEVDLFGRIRSLKDQMLQRFFATEEAQRSARLTLVAEVAVQYLGLRALDAQVALANETLKLVESSLEITQSKYAAGVATELDFRMAEAQRETARVNLVAYQLQREQAQNALVVLLGRPLPADLPPPSDATTMAIADVSPGLPSELLERRPDILQAEYMLKAANANIGAARAAFYPSITLTAVGGVSSRELNHLFDGQSTMWQFTPQVNVPIFTGGRNDANLNAAKVQKSIEIAHYEKVIQVAFREVADALAARAQLGAQLEAQTARVTSDERRYELSKLRYDKGVDSYLTVLTAQQDLYAAQQMLIQGQLARSTNLVALYKALGGGWRARSTDASGSPGDAAKR